MQNILPDALLACIIALSYLLYLSKAIASSYFSRAPSKLPSFNNAFPSSFKFSHFFVFFKAIKHFLLSGSFYIPAVNNFLAFSLYIFY